MADIVQSNARLDQGPYRGWFLGNFVEPNSDPRSSKSLELKWGSHKAGEAREAWAQNHEASTLCLLIKGKFRIKLRGTEYTLDKEGDYLVWPPLVPHIWQAEEDSEILTIRWPSMSNDSREVPKKDLDPNWLA